MAVAPVALVVDVVTLPVSAYEDENPFSRTSAMLSSAGQNITKAVEVK